MFRYRNRALADEILNKIASMNLDGVNFMHICGTHQDTVVRYGLDRLLSEVGIRIRQGPGCPVCVTTQLELLKAQTLAEKGKTIAIFGDLLNIKVNSRSLADIRACGADVRVVYSIDNALELSRSEPDKEFVFIAVGFETTAPSTASVLKKELPENFYILSFHRYLIPAIKKLLELGELKISGIIEPGHVSSIIGVEPYEFISKEYKIPQVICGFEPMDILVSCYMLARQLKNGPKLENEYTRAVNEGGNQIARRLIEEVFEPADIEWRGFPVIEDSMMSIKEPYARSDASKVFESILGEVKEPEPVEGCRCGELLRGLIEPKDCPLFRKVCTPRNPIGPCMVSSEGSCNIEFRYSQVEW